MYDFVIQNPQVLQSPIEHHCVKLYVYGHTETKFPQAVIECFCLIIQQQNDDSNRRDYQKDHGKNKIILSLSTPL